MCIILKETGIIRWAISARVVLKRTAVGDWCFYDLNGGRRQSQVNAVFQL